MHHTIKTPILRHLIINPITHLVEIFMEKNPQMFLTGFETRSSIPIICFLILDRYLQFRPGVEEVRVETENQEQRKTINLKLRTLTR
jgi:hypothetical protein